MRISEVRADRDQHRPGPRHWCHIWKGIPTAPLCCVDIHRIPGWHLSRSMGAAQQSDDLISDKKSQDVIPCCRVHGRGKCGFLVWNCFVMAICTSACSRP